MFYQFATALSFSNLYVPHTVINLDLIITFNKEKKDWMKKYYKIIQELETTADIQLQIQDIIKQADTVNNQLVDIKTILLQAGKTYKIQVKDNIYSISEELHIVIYTEMER